MSGAAKARFVELARMYAYAKLTIKIAMLKKNLYKLNTDIFINFKMIKYDEVNDILYYHKIISCN